MPRFYLHLRDDLDVPDEEGVELPDLEAARALAASSARFTLAQKVMDEGKINFDHRIDIEDEQGRILDTMWFQDVLQIEGRVDTR